jgi:hypothetical protein
MAQNPVETLVGDDGSVNPTIKMSAGGAGGGQTLVQFTGNPSLSGSVPTTVALYTVPAGKTLFITDIYVGASTNLVFLAQIQAAGVSIFFGYCKGDTGPIEIPGIETQPQGGPGTAVTLVMGIAAGTTAAYFISGFVQ